MNGGYEIRESGSDPQGAMEWFKQVIRSVGGLAGVIAIVVGVVYVTKVIKLLLDLLSAPDGGASVGAMVEMLGGAELTIASAHGPVAIATPLAVLFFIAGLLVLGWLSLGLIITGAKVVSYCLTDRKSIKELLSYAFGPKGKPEEPAGNQKKAAANINS